MTTAEARKGAALGLVIAVGILTGIAVIVAGVAFGGPWRWVAGAATLAFIALIVVPGFVTDKHNNDFEGDR